MSTTQVLPPRIELPTLDKGAFDIRAIKNTVLTGLVWGIAILASIPLFSVIFMLIVEGGARLDIEAITAIPPAGFEMGGGFGNAIVGTLVMVGIASALSIPIGVMSAIYLAILEPGSKLAKVSKFLAKVLTGFPSILAGVFVYAVIVITTGTYSAWAGGVALAVLMLPTVTLAAEEAMKQVPQKMKDAAYGMGCTRTQVIFNVAAGESAPLLFTALFSNYYMEELAEPTASLSILIYNFSGMPFDNQIELAWAASLILVVLVLFFNILARVVGRTKFRE